MKVILIQNKQFFADVGDTLCTDKFDLDVGSTIEFPIVGSLSNYKDTGVALLEVVKHYKDPKKLWFRKTPRNNDRRTRGHRSHKTMFVCKEIQLS